tara:strand:- start:177 stop:287 length:111 start_codon:yes stop_codon:yes gene_type:complete
MVVMVGHLEVVILMVMVADLVVMVKKHQHRCSHHHS